MPQYVYDGSLSFEGGQNDGILSDRISTNQYVRGVNITTKTGGLSPRPAYSEIPLKIRDEDTLINNLTYKQIYRRGKFQALIAQNASDGFFIIAVISGVVFRIYPKTGDTEILSLPNIYNKPDRLNEYKRRIHWTVAGKYIVLFDYPNLPVIIDGNSIRRANPNNTENGQPRPEVPMSVLGTFVQNRMFIANEGIEFTGGDPVGATNGAPITFTEVLVIGADYYKQFFSLGAKDSNSQITAMGAFQVADTSTGYGPLFVATKNSIYTYAANTPRANWSNSVFGNMSLYNAGIAGARAFSNVNSDLIFIDATGQIRALSSSRYEQQKWGNTPISREISNLIDNPDSNLLECSFVETLSNRIFCSIRPFRTKTLDTFGNIIIDVAFNGLAVLELNNLAGLGRDIMPAWAGVWTGIKPLDVTKMGEDLYIFSKDYGSINRLYKLEENKGYDTVESIKKPIRSRIYTRLYDFAAGFENKTINNIDYTISNVAGNPLKMRVDYKTDSRPLNSDKWNLWKEWEHSANTETCNASCQELKVLLKHNFKNINLGDKEEEGCDKLTNTMSTSFRKIGLRISLEGNDWLLERLRFKAELESTTDSEDITCSSDSPIELEQECITNTIGDFDL